MALASLAHLSGRIPDADFGYNFSWLITPDDAVSHGYLFFLRCSSLPQISFLRCVYRLVSALIDL